VDDLNEPSNSAYRPQEPSANRWRWVGARGAKWRMPVPPGPPPELSKARREEEERAAARAARLHLPGLLSRGVIVMGLILAAVVVMSVVVLISHR
jgi:hypothetical protein